ncbi:hypothetical protein B0J18DRAFT_27785 [Chaetomium sp. MPI-SDFR-AT-0129]|nr:hypothetical protein B0J18DRAFT_27785 [Chaetomium sp. MPI-SDFR-AT-0129]
MSDTADSFRAFVDQFRSQTQGHLDELAALETQCNETRRHLEQEREARQAAQEQAVTLQHFLEAEKSAALLVQQRADGLEQDLEREQQAGQLVQQHVQSLKKDLETEKAAGKTLERDLAQERETGRNVQKEVEALKLEVECKQEAGRILEKQSGALAAELKDLEKSASRDPFVLVLIDADAEAYLFDSKYYLGNSIDGGERAAKDLKNAVWQHLTTLDSSLDEIPIVVRAYGSALDLGSLLVKSNVTKLKKAEQHLSGFARGFSQGDEMFDFVLVEKDKYRADYKLIATFKQFAENPTCKHILLACSADNSFAPMLAQFTENTKVLEKVTILNSFHTGTEFIDLPFPTTTMDAIFRNEPITPYGRTQVSKQRVQRLFKSLLQRTVLRSVMPNGPIGRMAASGELPHHRRVTPV